MPACSEALHVNTGAVIDRRPPEQVATLVTTLVKTGAIVAKRVGASEVDILRTPRNRRVGSPNSSRMSPLLNCTRMLTRSTLPGTAMYRIGPRLTNPAAGKSSA